MEMACFCHMVFGMPAGKTQRVKVNPSLEAETVVQEDRRPIEGCES